MTVFICDFLFYFDGCHVSSLTSHLVALTVFSCVLLPNCFQFPRLPLGVSVYTYNLGVPLFLVRPSMMSLCIPDPVLLWI